MHISCGGLRVYCHSLVLRLRCPSLLRALEEPSADGDHTGPQGGHCRQLELQSLPGDLKQGPFDTLLTYLYTDTLSDGFSDEELGPLVAACELFELPRLAELCERRLLDGLSPARAPAVVLPEAGRLEPATGGGVPHHTTRCRVRTHALPT